MVDGKKFRAWLNECGGTQKAGSTRLYAVRTIEKICQSWVLHSEKEAFAVISTLKNLEPAQTKKAGFFPSKEFEQEFVFLWVLIRADRKLHFGHPQRRLMRLSIMWRPWQDSNLQPVP